MSSFRDREIIFVIRKEGGIFKSLLFCGFNEFFVVKVY